MEVLEVLQDADLNKPVPIRLSETETVCTILATNFSPPYFAPVLTHNRFLFWISQAHGLARRPTSLLL
jgi:hypothetical protein